MNFVAIMFWITMLYLYTEPFVSYGVIMGEKKKNLRRSWIISFSVAVYLSIESIFYAIPAIFKNLQNLGSFTLQSNKRADFCCDLFIAYCVVEMILSYFKFYTIKKLEGWGHHLFYCTMLIYFRINQMTNSFWLLTWMEITTIMLALNTLQIVQIPSRIFIFVFLTIRIFLFGLFLYLFFWTLPKENVYFTAPWATLVMIAHCWWAKKIVNASALLVVKKNSE
jgi:hypothetical protein